MQRTDPKTGLYYREGFNSTLRFCVERGLVTSFSMFEVANIDALNGVSSVRGVAFLKWFGDAIRARLKTLQRAQAARLHGATFAASAKDEVPKLVLAMQKLRADVAGYREPGLDVLALTVVCLGSNACRDADSKTLLKKANEALHEERARGGDRVVVLP